MMCAFGFTIVLPFMVTLHWPLGECRVVNGSLNIEHCSCNKKISQYDRCIARYPCLQVCILCYCVYVCLQICICVYCICMYVGATVLYVYVCEN